MAKYKLNSVTYDPACRVPDYKPDASYSVRRAAGRTPGVIRLNLFPVYVIENPVTEITVVYFRRK